MAQQHDKGKNWTDGKSVGQVSETDGSSKTRHEIG